MDTWTSIDWCLSQIISAKLPKRPFAVSEKRKSEEQLLVHFPGSSFDCGAIEDLQIKEKRDNKNIYSI